MVLAPDQPGPAQPTQRRAGLTTAGDPPGGPADTAGTAGRRAGAADRPAGGTGRPPGGRGRPATGTDRPAAGTGRPVTRAELAALVDRGLTLTADRGDLRHRLEQTRHRLADPAIRVIVVGEVKQGKSALVNALVGASVCPVDDDVATALPTLVRHGEVPAAALLTGGSPPERHPVPLERLAEHVTVTRPPVRSADAPSRSAPAIPPVAPTSSGDPPGAAPAAAEITLPRALLAEGLVLIDSPGVGGLDSAHALTTLTALPMADAVLFVSDASQEYTEPEIRFLRQAMRVCPNVAAVLTKTDLYPRWRQVADLDRAHLAEAAPGVPLLPVSAHLRLRALRQADTDLNRDSGFPDLVRHLRSAVLGQAEVLQRRSVAAELLFTTEHLRLSARAELAALRDPAATPTLVAGLEEAKRRADDQRRRSARWQTTLADGMSDLIADMEYDLRDRLRTIQRDAETAIDAGDPGPVWPEFAEWLETRTASAVSDTFVWTNERSTWLATQVAAHFAEAETALPALRVGDTAHVLDPVSDVAALADERLGLAQKVLIGMRGSYGGVLMFGLLTGIAGMALVNPISVAAGLLLGGKAYREDQQTRLRKRQAEAKAIVRRQIDDVTFQVGKQLRDRLRLVQRLIRDHFGQLAEEEHRSLTDAVRAAQQASTTYTTERQARIRALTARLESIEELHVRAAALPGTGER